MRTKMQFVALGLIVFTPAFTSGITVENPSDSSTSLSIQLFVKNYPAADTQGVFWTFYDLSSPENRNNFKWYISNNYTVVFGSDLFVSGDCGMNFPDPCPVPTDSIILIGSWDSSYYNNPGTYGDNIHHTGFYWLYSDVAGTDPQTWSDDTLRVMPKPIVTKTGPGGGADDTIWVNIPNPRETRYTGQTAYDVLGYWIVADSTGTGTPSAYADPKAVAIDFISVQGIFGDTTEFYMMESDSFAPWDLYDVYFAYKIVARPDTIGGSITKIPGYSTYHYSQNSDMIQVYQNVVGVEEQKALKPKTELQCVFPNPFVHTAKIAYALATAAHVELKVYDVAGQLVRTVLNGAQGAGEHVVEFDGALLPSGVYFYQFETSEKKFAGRLLKLE
ncbi:T9SS type A sorting domain-containing protein [candidate division WOR-3 bacterium]|nr:T9SS type A sorting domain-containing protein [candidate division WOR-3 bacterium]